MMAGNPSSWSMNGMHPQSQFSNSSSSSSSTAAADNHHNHHLPSQDIPIRSWSQLLMGGLGVGEEERLGATFFHQEKKLENWEDQVLDLNPTFPRSDHVKQETTQSSCRIYDDEFHNKPSNSWPHHNQIMPVSSPTSCITSLCNNINFSGGKTAAEGKNYHHNQEHSSECNNTNTGGVSKKARVQQSAQPALKVRKEKLGDRITALHQIVSPFGKTDTASVLSEAIGYIRFLHGQVEALSSPYLRNASVGTGHHPQHSVQERNCLYSEEGGQDPQSEEITKDLSSRGLCLIPISCTQNVGNDIGADYWAPPYLGGDF